jgi:magnesium chelatase family protein
MVSLAAERGLKRAFVPAVDAAEASLVQGVDVFPVRTLTDLVNHLAGDITLEPVRGDADSLANPIAEALVDFADVKGQEHVKRGLEVAAAGAHNLIELWTEHLPSLRDDVRNCCRG